MRKVVAYHLLSLDGVAQDPETFVHDFDPAMDANLAEVIGTQDAVLLGRRMYDEWAVYWPRGEHQPFADFINAVPKHVATSTPLSRPWTNAQAIEGPVEDFVRRLKDGEGGDVGLHGSIALTRSMLVAGLVDELRLVIAPQIVGHGRRLFDGDVPHALRLVHCTSTPSGSLLLRYDVARS
jgi:dihydrofolate reductase